MPLPLRVHGRALRSTRSPAAQLRHGKPPGRNWIGRAGLAALSRGSHYSGAGCARVSLTLNPANVQTSSALLVGGVRLADPVELRLLLVAEIGVEIVDRGSHALHRAEHDVEPF